LVFVTGSRVPCHRERSRRILRFLLAACGTADRGPCERTMLAFVGWRGQPRGERVRQSQTMRSPGSWNPWVRREQIPSSLPQAFAERNARSETNKCIFSRRFAPLHAGLRQSGIHLLRFLTQGSPTSGPPWLLICRAYGTRDRRNSGNGTLFRV